VTFSPDGKRLASASWDQTVKVWDARPWTPELRVEQQAMSWIRFYSTSPISTDELLSRIRAHTTVNDAVRERALEFARQRKEQ
jgi:WD40 repeat protein